MREQSVFFDRLRSIGFDTCLISNNQEPRVKPFAEKVQSKYVFNAHKPSTKNYIKAMELMQTDRGNTVFIGDQLFTDVWGSEAYRDEEYSGEADLSKRRDPDCAEKIFGENCITFL